MKKSNNINRLFENAREVEPLLKLKKIEELLDGKDNGTVKSKNKLFSLKKLIIMTTLISLTITAIVSMMNIIDIEPEIEKKTTTEVAVIETLKQETIVDSESTDNNAIQSKPNQHKIFPVSITDTPTKEDIPRITLLTTPGVNLLQLNKEELRTLGVFTGGNGISVPSRLGENENRYLTFSSSGTMIRRNSQLASILNVNSDDAKIIIDRAKTLPIPLVITDDIGQHWRAFLDIRDIGDIKHVQAKINTLVPILVRSGEVYTLEDSLENNWRPDVILWYEPTSEFLALLPNQYAKEIKTEKEAIFAYIDIEKHKEKSLEIKKIPETLRNENKDTVKSDDIIPTTPSCKYFEACKPNSKSIKKVLIYPNPTNGRFKVAVELEDPRTVTIHLTDISGKVTLSLHSQKLQQSGTIEYPCDISDLSSGVYLLRVETKKGERVTQRIIKR